MIIDSYFIVKPQIEYATNSCCQVNSEKLLQQLSDYKIKCSSYVNVMFSCERCVTTNLLPFCHTSLVRKRTWLLYIAVKYNHSALFFKHFIYWVQSSVAYLGFHFGGGSKFFWKSGGICMARSAMQRVAKPHVC